MKYKLFDAHCHLQLRQFDADRDAVIARMQENGVGGIIVGTDLETSTAGLALAKTQDFLWASVGLHPNDNLKEEFDAVAFEALARDPKVVVIGECGLDYFRSGGTPEEKSAQKIRFEKHIVLAIKVKKALIIHCRNAHDDMLEVLSAHRGELNGVPIIIHFFTGTADLALKYLDLGCCLSFPGPITYSEMYDESVKVTPLDRMFAETDSPFAAPVPHRGKRNEPIYVAEIIKKMASLKGISVDRTADYIEENFKRVFLKK